MAEIEADATGRPIVDPQSDDEPTPIPTPPGGSQPEGQSDTNTPEKAAAPPPTMSPFRERAATVTAIAVIVALGAFYAYMLAHADDAEQLHWERRMIILNGVEAIVFGAAGFLFGTQVQRRVDGAQIATAQNRAEEQGQDARRSSLRAEIEAEKAKAAQQGEHQAEVKASRGEMLAEAVLAKASRSGAASRAPSRDKRTKAAPAEAFGEPSSREPDDDEILFADSVELDELRRLAMKVTS